MTNHSPQECQICHEYHCLAGCVPIKECVAKSLMANWRQVFGSEHKCYPPDEIMEEALADARADIYFHDNVEHGEGENE